VIDVRVPKIGMSTIEVEIVQVKVGVGQHVEPTSVVASASADKIDFDIEAGVSGRVEEILVSEGAVVPVGGTVARVRESDPTT
jgi:pyruvate/2-oxoglutarate dehydrogenase complex dihydrolipoamide acyltransferase (E2) component